MRTLALCSYEYERWVKKAAGVQPILSPPFNAEVFKPSIFQSYDLLYIKLYGLENQPYWVNKQDRIVLDAEQVGSLNLKGTTVFVANCYLPDSPMLAALLQAGAKAVVGGDGFNYFRKSKLAGADLLGLNFRRALQMGLSPKKALAVAKAPLKFKERRGKADKVTMDTLAFKVWRE